MQCLNNNDQNYDSITIKKTNKMGYFLIEKEKKRKWLVLNGK